MEEKTFEINEETMVLEPEEVEIVDELTEVETTEESEEEPEEEKKSNTTNVLLAGAAIVGIATAGYKIFKKVKARKNQKEDEEDLDLDINKIREDVVTKLTNDGLIDRYKQFDIDMMANCIYDLTKDYNLK